MTRSVLSICLLLLVAAPAWAAQPKELPACAGLEPDALARAVALMGSEYLYDCCDETVQACLAAATPCPLARRLGGEICRRVGAGESDEAVGQALRLRARSMMPGGAPATIDLLGTPSLGDPEAPVVMVEYACVRCPFCARLTPKLEQAIAEGPLKGKVRLHFKLFPIKGHDGSTESGLAALAAHDQGRFWEFLGLAYERFDDFAVSALPALAAEAGADPAAWEAARAAGTTREALVASKREGMANGVEATPTFFISGRRYHGDLSVDQLVDVLLEEHERLAGERP
jgi:protein-disulfide isomerase